MGKIKDLLGGGKPAVGHTEFSPGSEVPSIDMPPPPPHVMVDDESPTFPPIATQGTEHPIAEVPVVRFSDQSGKQARVELVGEGVSFGEYLLFVFGPDSDGGRHVTPQEWKQIGKRATHFGVRILVDLLH